MAEQRVPNDSIVVRGGIMELRRVREQAEDEFRRCGTYSISIVANPGASLDNLAQVGRLPNPKIRKAVVGQLRAWGFDVTPPKGNNRHSNLVLAKQRSVTDKDWIALVSLFDDAEVNPHPYRGQP